MNLKDLLMQAKAGDDKALTGLLMMYRPLLLKESIVDGIFEDVYKRQAVAAVGRGNGRELLGDRG